MTISKMLPMYQNQLFAIFFFYQQKQCMKYHSKISSKDLLFRFLVPKYCPSCDVPHCVKPVKTKHGAGGDLFVRWQSTWYSTQILPPSSSLRMTCGKFSWGSQLLCCCFFSAQSADVLRSYFAKSTPLSSYEAEKKAKHRNVSNPILHCFS